MKKGLVSIVVSSYNVEKYIKKCITSIYNQTYQNYEVIIVNDDSKDSTLSIVEESCLFDERFKVYSKENGGLSSARNYGLERANGEYIVFIDSDDWILPGFIQELVSGFDNKTDIVISKYCIQKDYAKSEYNEIYPEEKSRLEYEGVEKEKEIFERHIIAYPQTGYEIKTTLMPVWKNMYRVSFLRENDLTFISERISYPEDYIFNLMAYLKAQKICFLSNASYVHLIVAKSLSKRYDRDIIDRIISRHNVVSDFLKENCEESEKYIELAEQNLLISIVVEIRKLVLSNEKDKDLQIKKITNNPTISNILHKKMNYNIENKFLPFIYVLKSKNIFLIYLLNKISGLI